jgi:DtxR family transcriptional regulator, Mn-dependent transcriptional regulator
VSEGRADIGNLAPAGSHGRERRQYGQEAVEDYSKAIYALERRNGGAAVTTTELAQRLEVTPGAVTSMLKKMAGLGLVDHSPYRGARLTEDGTRVALEVMRHHRLLETYLSEALGMPWDRVHDEAEVLEHYISEELEERISAALGHPDRDPHGDPIPNRNLEGEGGNDGVPLSTARPGQKGVLVRVSDGNPEMLRYLAEREIRPGCSVTIIGRQPLNGPLLVEVDGVEHLIGETLAERMVALL